MHYLSDWSTCSAAIYISAFSCIFDRTEEDDKEEDKEEDKEDKEEEDKEARSLSLSLYNNTKRAFFSFVVQKTKQKKHSV